MKGLQALGLALQFLTRLPVPQGLAYTKENLGWSVIAYPLVGLLIGGLLLLVHGLLGQTSPLLTSALLLTVWVALTGGLHLDGLADCADAWVGGQGERERSLRIMQDPCSGPIAVAVVVLLLLLKFAALTELLGRQAWTPLLIAPVVGRSLIPLVLLTTPYVRPHGLGSPLAENLPRFSAWLAVLSSLLIALMLLGPWPVGVTVLVAGWLRAQMLSQLGGCTGDTLGATVEIGEMVILVVSAF